jgi:HK97 gp10 family phage protein
MTFIFKPNKNLENDLRKDIGYEEGLLAKAAEAADAAKTFAPVRTGAYRDGIKAQKVGGKVYVSGTDWKSNFIEHGTSKMPPQAPLRRGVRAAGMRLKEKS